MKTRKFAIGYLTGGMWALGIVAVVAFIMALVTLQSRFLWACLILEVVIPLLWAIKTSSRDPLRRN